MSQKSSSRKSLFFWDACIVTVTLLITACMVLGFSLAGRVPGG